MFTAKNTTLTLIAASLFALPTAALAQDAGKPKATLAVAEDDDVNKERSPYDSPDQDPTPKPPKPDLAIDEDGPKVEKQAGIGGVTAYATEGVVELGGSAGFTAAGDLMALDINPSIGWFISDNFELSGILGMTYAEVNGNDASAVSALVEPSYHLPFTDEVFGFAGLGAGVQYAQGAGTGLAVKPRLGMNLLVGRSGIFTPSINVGYSTVDANSGANGTVLTVEPSVGFNAGYTVMW